MELIKKRKNYQNQFSFSFVSKIPKVKVIKLTSTFDLIVKLKVAAIV
jgi:hypothetical protein